MNTQNTQNTEVKSMNTQNTQNTQIKGKKFKQVTYNGYIALVDAFNNHTDISKAAKCFSDIVKAYTDIDFDTNDFSRIIARLATYSKKYSAVRIMSIGFYRQLVINKDNCLVALVAAGDRQHRGRSGLPH